MSSPRRGQSGQALVGVLVVLMLVVAMAGALSVVASAVLRQQAQTGPRFSTDLTTSNALMGALGQIAYGSSVPPLPACDNQRSKSLTSVLPGGFTSVASCLRVDDLSEAATDHGIVRLDAPTNGCSITPLVSPVATTHFRLWFTALGAITATTIASNGDLDQLCGGSTATGCTGGVVPAPIGVTQFTQVSFQCDLTGLTPVPKLWLYVRTSSNSPATARYGKYDQGEASAYDVAAPTGLAGSNAFMEADLYGEDSLSLTYEGSLP